MTSWLDSAALIFAAASAAAVVLIVVRRSVTDLSERAHRIRREKMTPLALALIAGDPGSEGEVEALGRRDGAALGELAGRYGRQLQGADLERITALLESRGDVDRTLRKLLYSFRAWKRARAAYALGDMGSRQAVNPLLMTLQTDRVRDVRSCAARSLGRLGAAEAAGPLVEAIADTGVPRAVAGLALVSIGPQSLPMLMPKAEHEDPQVRAMTARIIGLVGDPGCGEKLLPLLRDPTADVRAGAAGALGRLASRPATDELRQRLSDPAPEVRVAAARALGQIGNREAVPDLLLTAKEEGFNAAREAATAIANLESAALDAEGLDRNDHMREAADRLRVGVPRPLTGGVS